MFMAHKLLCMQIARKLNGNYSNRFQWRPCFAPICCTGGQFAVHLIYLAACMCVDATFFSWVRSCDHRGSGEAPTTKMIAVRVKRTPNHNWIAQSWNDRRRTYCYREPKQKKKRSPYIQRAWTRGCTTERRRRCTDGNNNNSTKSEKQNSLFHQWPCLPFSLSLSLPFFNTACVRLVARRMRAIRVSGMQDRANVISGYYTLVLLLFCIHLLLCSSLSTHTKTYRVSCSILRTFIDNGHFIVLHFFVVL